MREYKLNKVDGFNPFDHIETAKNRHGEDIIKSDGKPLEYMNSDAKCTWFKMVYPKGSIRTRIEKTAINDYATSIIAVATVEKEPGVPLAEWTKQITCWDIADEDDAVSKAQTIALGKALSKAGFGCEIEMMLKLGLEGELPEEEAPEAPKKKRGRPKKEATPVSSETLEDTVDALLAEVEDIAAPAVESPKNSDEVAEKIEKLLDMELEITDKAPINIKKLSGMKFRDILAEHKNFGTLVKTRPNIRKAITDECAEALIFIEENKM